MGYDRKGTFTINLFRTGECDVDYQYSKGTEEIYYHDSSGHPGDSPEIYVEHVWVELKARNGRKIRMDVLDFILDLDTNINLDYLEEQNHVGNENYVNTGISLNFFAKTL